MTKKKPVLLDTNEAEWQPVEMPNLPYGAFMKLLNIVEQKDDCTFLLITDGPLDFNLKR